MPEWVNRQSLKHKYALAGIPILWRLRIVYFVTGLGFGAFMPYVGAMLENSGFSSGQVGVLTSLGILASILTQPLWGMVADRFGWTRFILTLNFMVPALLSILFHSTAWLLVAMVSVGFFVFKNPQAPIMDAYAISVTRESGGSYGTIRFFQSIGFGVGGYLAGMYLTRFVVTSLWIPFMILSILGVLVVFTLPPRDPEVKHGTRSSEHLKALMKPHFLIFLLAAFLVSQTLSAFNIYYVIIYRQLGGSASTVGLGIIVAAVSNVPSMWAADKLIRKVGRHRVLMLAASLYMTRWVLQAFVVNPHLIILIQLLHGSFGLFYVSSVDYVAETMSPRIRATAQSVFGMVVSGVAGIVGNVLNGALLGFGGPELMYGVCGASAFAGIVIYGFLRKAKVPSIQNEGVTRQA